MRNFLAAKVLAQQSATGYSMDGYTRNTLAVALFQTPYDKRQCEHFTQIGE